MSAVVDIVKAMAGAVANELALGDSPYMPSTHFDDTRNTPECWADDWTDADFEAAQPFVEALDLIVAELRPD